MLFLLFYRSMFDLIILPSFIIYSLGLQWAWQFNIIFLPINIGFESYCDHYIISSINKKSIIGPLFNIDRSIINRLIVSNNYLFIQKLLFIIRPSSTDSSTEIEIIRFMVTRYLFDISQYILLPIYSFIRLFVYSFDVIHTLGFYSWGIKIDAIPGRINLATTLRLLWKGEYRGKCFELCGQGHLSMLITTLVAFSLFYLLFNSFLNIIHWDRSIFYIILAQLIVFNKQSSTFSLSFPFLLSDRSLFNLTANYSKHCYY